MCNEILDENDNISENDFNIFLSMIFSLILFKKNIKCSFIYSTCLNKSLMKDLCQVSIKY